jgi:hypothetical protein
MLYLAHIHMYIFKVIISYALAIKYKIYNTILLFHMQYNITPTSLNILDNKITDHSSLDSELPKLIILVNKDFVP